MTFEVQLQQMARVEFLWKIHGMLEKLRKGIDQEKSITLTLDEARFLFLAMTQASKCETCLREWERSGLTISPKNEGSTS